jgi:hypothetical protein
MAKADADDVGWLATALQATVPRMASPTEPPASITLTARYLLTLAAPRL